MRIVSFKRLAQVDTNSATAVAVKRFADQLREARASNPLPSLLRMVDEMRQGATQEAQQLPSFQYDVKSMQPQTSPEFVTDEGVEDVKPAKPTKRTRKRKPTLAGVARQAAKAGVEVAGYEVRPDGTIKVITGKPVGGGEIDTATPHPSEWN